MLYDVGICVGQGLGCSQADGLEDVVAGIRTPQPLARIGANGVAKEHSMEATEPELYRQLLGAESFTPS